MSFNGVDQRYYTGDDEDMVDSVDGIDEEYHTAEDANLDEYEMVSHILGQMFLALLQSAFPLTFGMEDKV